MVGIRGIWYMYVLPYVILAYSIFNQILVYIYYIDVCVCVCVCVCVRTQGKERTVFCCFDNIALDIILLTLRTLYRIICEGLYCCRKTYIRTYIWWEQLLKHIILYVESLYRGRSHNNIVQYIEYRYYILL